MGTTGLDGSFIGFMLDQLLFFFFIWEMESLCLHDGDDPVAVIHRVLPVFRLIWIYFFM